MADLKVSTDFASFTTAGLHLRFHLQSIVEMYV